MIKLRCGSVVVLGKTNVGKSTLLNVFIEKKTSIISSKCNTTRENIFGVYTYRNNQIVFIDTPGFHDDKNFLCENFYKKISNFDIILYVIDPFYWNLSDDKIVKKLKQLNFIVILVINKIDKLNYRSFLLYRIKEISDKYEIYDIVPISAIKNLYIDLLKNRIISYLPIQNHLYPIYKKSVINIDFYLKELIREKLINMLRVELSYSLDIMINNVFIKENIVFIDACIIYFKFSHKSILLGYKGKFIKNISKQSRINIENYFEKKVFLILWLKSNV